MMKPVYLSGLVCALAWYGLSIAAIRGHLAVRQPGHTTVRTSFALASLSAPSEVRDVPPDTDGGSLCISRWLAPEERGPGTVRDLQAIDQSGAPISWHAFRDRPTALAFFYARCENPQKCSRTVGQVARLQQLLADTPQADAVRLGLVTFEPDRDLPEQLKTFAEARGIHFDQSPETRVFVFPTTELAHLLTDLHVEVAYNGSWVTAHGIALYLFDRQGRYVRHYHSIPWQPSDVAADLMRLTAEAP